MIRILWFLAGVGATALLTTDTGRRVADELGNATTDSVKRNCGRLVDGFAPKAKDDTKADAKEKDNA